MNEAASRILATRDRSDDDRFDDPMNRTRSVLWTRSRDCASRGGDTNIGSNRRIGDSDSRRHRANYSGVLRNRGVEHDDR